ncbi:MAG TPA: YbjN domain-containing protein [Haliangiales bacterium]|nr:YbjN domain-containing protein [Haliangiales bacterium]
MKPIRNLAELARRLGEARIFAPLSDDGTLLRFATRFGADAPMVVHWEPGAWLIRLAQILPVSAADARAIAGAEALLRLHRESDLVRVVHDDDDDTVLLRTQVYATADGLDYDTFERVVAASVDEADQCLALLGAAPQHTDAFAYYAD